MKKVVLFGASTLGSEAYKCLNSISDIAYFCDNNTDKWGKKLLNIEIISPEFLAKNHEKYEVIIASMYYKEISQQLFGMGYDHVKVFGEEKVFYEYEMANDFEGICTKLIDTKNSLVVPKNQYIIQKRNDRDYDKLDEIAVDNSEESWNVFWNSPQNIKEYLSNDRMEIHKEIWEIIKGDFVLGSLMDVGCGSGEFLRLAKEKGKFTAFYGIDFSQASIDFCKKNIQGVDFAVGSAYELNSTSSQYNNVICMEVLEHLQFPNRVLKSLYKIVKPKGKLIITIPNGTYDTYVGHINFWSKIKFEQLIMTSLGECHFRFSYLKNKLRMVFIIDK